jgi:hypothetical protein
VPVAPSGAPFDVLCVEAAGRSARPGDAAAARAAASADAQSTARDRRAADRRLRARVSRSGSAADRIRAGAAALGWDRRFPERDLALPAAPWPQHAREAAFPGRRLPRCLPATARARTGAAHRGRAAGRVVGIDCLYVGRLRGTADAIWQLTAIDCYSSFAWAQLVVYTQGNPTALQASTLARRVARELKAAGWQLERVVCDNGTSFESSAFAPPSYDSAPASPTSTPAGRTPTPRRSAAQDDPRRVLASSLRALSPPTPHRAQPPARPLPRLPQHRPRPPRPPHPRPHPHRHRLPCPQDGTEMSRTCRHTSEAVQPNGRQARRSCDAASLDCLRIHPPAGLLTSRGRATY